MHIFPLTRFCAGKSYACTPFNGYIPLFLTLSLIIFPASDLLAQRIFEIGEEWADTSNYDLSDYLEILELSPEDSMGIESVREKPELFQAFHSGQTLLKRYHSYWGKVSFRNTLNYRIKVIFSPDWNLGIYRNSLVDLYASGNGQDKILKSGRLLAASKKANPDVNNNTFVFYLDSAETIQLYFYVRQIEGSIPSFNPTLMDSSYWLIPRKKFSTIVQAIYHGIAWILFLYTMITFIATRVTAFLYYALFVASISIYFLYSNGNLTNWFLSENPTLSLYFWIVFTNLIAVTYFQFCRILINTKKLIPLWDLVARWIIRVLFVLIIIELIICYITYDQNILNWMIDITILSLALILFIAIIRYLRTSNILARIFFYGSFCIVFAGIYGVISDIMGQLRDHFYIIEASFVAQFLIFSLGLGTKLRLAEKAKLVQEIEASKAKELEKVKSRFFANISHEFRTPLTIILGNLDQLEQSWPSNRNKAEDKLESLQRNTRYTLNLVNQILDLSRIESNKLNPKWENADIVAFLRYLVASFQLYAENKTISLSLDSEQDSFFMDYDTEQLQSIFANLLSNALKFTPEGGTVVMKTRSFSKNDGQFLEVVVQDNGIGISHEDLPYIFNRFYQVENQSGYRHKGTGIGLALARELVGILEGNISVQSEPGLGTTFTVQLPIHQQADRVVHSVSQKTAKNLSYDFGLVQVKDESKKRAENFEKDLVLVVDDNPEIRDYLRNILEKHYRVILAKDGNQGLEIAQKQIPDLVISDIRMPGRDGIELTQTLKNDDRSSHIPVILLSARASTKSRISGLEAGADAYLVKPFDKDELLAQSSQIINLRENLRNYFSKEDSNTSTPAPGIKREDNFIRNARKVIEANLSNPEFKVENLCEGLGLTYTQVHRKIKALTGRTASIFIRGVRLNKAKNLLVSTDDNISQIAYEVGFNDPNFFSRAFSQEFSLSPTEFRQQNA